MVRFTEPRVATWGCALVFATCLTFARPAFAQQPSPEVMTCVNAYENAQRLRLAHRLLAAKGTLLTCMNAQCPAVLRRDCAEWLGETDAAIPSVVVAARGPDGRPRDDVRVSIDGAPVAQRSLSTPIALDPGEHVLSFEIDGAPKIEERVTLREGEREHHIEVIFAAIAPAAPALPPAPAAATAPVPAEAPPASERRSVSPLVYVLGGTGLAAAGVGTYFQLSGMSKRSSLEACAPSCAQSDVDDARRTTWIGNVALWVGVASLATAAILYFSQPSGQAR